ncbi:hypothetical protein CJF42_23320 [Pseudoalteromonas sp. NBT06-2]|uniref:hypothetical protein n=1 Tax=Pseudoalteromonas sp. NBT06-2 TaxID=2025950 RepID=UPI000BA767B4|nr:hypothetical protein [Pseudoalteromonas sp. NBT06-2]PAJ72053.1 hypothetical protein CJF42_23320 [Pseudoalteromonas sp. NBT06-2]
MEQQITIKELRKNLKNWGRFWRSKESIQGYATTSINERSDQTFASRNHSGNIFVPQIIDELTNLMTQLRPECIRALRARYIHEAPLKEAAILLGFESKRSAEFWLTKAEREILSRI